jgi:hypothetical protein
MLIPITLASPSCNPKLPSGLIKISHDEIVLVELQGSLEVELTHPRERDGKFVGTLKIDDATVSESVWYAPSALVSLRAVRIIPSPSWTPSIRKRSKMTFDLPDFTSIMLTSLPPIFLALTLNPFLPPHAHLEQTKPPYRAPSPRGQNRNAAQTICRPRAQRRRAEYHRNRRRTFAPEANGYARGGRQRRRRRQRCDGRRHCAGSRIGRESLQRGLDHQWDRKEENHLFEAADACSWEEMMSPATLLNIPLYERTFTSASRRQTEIRWHQIANSCRIPNDRHRHK